MAPEAGALHQRKDYLHMSGTVMMGKLLNFSFSFLTNLILKNNNNYF